MLFGEVNKYQGQVFKVSYKVAQDTIQCKL